MSLLNKMLRDLEHRRADNEGAVPEVTGVKAVAPPAGQRRPMVFLGAFALLAAAVAVVTHELPGFWRSASDGGPRVTPKVSPGPAKGAESTDVASAATPQAGAAVPVAVALAVPPDTDLAEAGLPSALRISAEIESPIQSDSQRAAVMAQGAASLSPSAEAQAVRVVDNALQVGAGADGAAAPRLPPSGGSNLHSPGTGEQQSLGTGEQQSLGTGEQHSRGADGQHPPAAGEQQAPGARMQASVAAMTGSSPAKMSESASGAATRSPTDQARSPPSTQKRQQAAPGHVARPEVSVAAIEKNLREPDTRQRAAQAVESGLQNMARKQYAEAQRAFSAALALDPHNDRARQALLSALLAMDDKQAAEPIADEGMLQGVAKVGFALVSARLKLERGAVREALAVLERERAAGAAHADYLALWGNALSREARYGDAARMYAAAVERAPANPAHHVGLGYALRNDGQFSSAQAVFLSVAEMQGLSPQLADLVEQQLGSLQRLVVKR